MTFEWNTNKLIYIQYNFMLLYYFTIEEKWYINSTIARSSLNVMIAHDKYDNTEVRGYKTSVWPGILLKLLFIYDTFL